MPEQTRNKFQWRGERIINFCGVGVRHGTLEKAREKKGGSLGRRSILSRKHKRSEWKVGLDDEAVNWYTGSL